MLAIIVLLRRMVAPPGGTRAGLSMAQEKAPRGQAGGARVPRAARYSPAAARSASALSVRSQVKAVKVSAPTVISYGVRPK